jgi:hypothetical protein
MGVPDLNEGSIERADLDGRNRMRVMCANLDGSQVETLVQAGSGDEEARDQTRWCVGIALDRDRSKIYWSQKGPDNAGFARVLEPRLEQARMAGALKCEGRSVRPIFVTG